MTENSRATKRLIVKIMTDFGSIKIELYAENAPSSVANFMKYVNKNLYQDTSFFRILDQRNQADSNIRIDVIQGGLKNDDLRLFAPVRHETTAETGLTHKDGTISLARWGGAGSAQGSFFICVGEQPALDFGGRRNPDGHGFAAFGQVVDGMDVVREIWSKAGPDEYIEPEIVIHKIERVD